MAQYRAADHEAARAALRRAVSLDASFAGAEEAARVLRELEASGTR
jgi:hypothetical protein